jgi:hypothetical protein
VFRAGHIAFIFISFVLIAVGLFVTRRIKPTIDQLIRVFLPLALVCETFKLLWIIEIVPIVDVVVEGGQLVYHETGAFSPYLMTQHLPIELCSLQMVFMFLSLVVKDPMWKRRLHALVYGTALAGGLLAIFLSSIAPDFETAGEFLTSPFAWEFYIYHAMIVVLALYIGLDKECDLRFADFRFPAMILVFLDLLSFYMNSILSVPVFSGGEVKGLAYALNFFSSYDDPLGLTLATKSQYLLYLVVRYVVGTGFFVLMYVPLLKRGPSKDTSDGLRP